ncbi:MurR/RpiR family transcriptional regulator [Oceanobacillus halophilus]|uniref:MurR/RpiR family transcriptional regulator n=1 Tax=Oceanobacillus halophilus TaxID=930130 RepID=A0A494ZZV5_9BACI|nr:MurR/RpiR family transcriptional regulator [Oceanobacillus halophilus]RKQ32529.1 MurR/RpiR family transcriptional regulator [Oceanobacillus halophilus]
MQNGMERIRQGIKILNPSERKVAEFIFHNPQEILEMPIAKLSKKTNTSEATIIRMCRSLHFKGFRELKLSISASINQGNLEVNKYQDISADATLSEIIESISNNNMHAINSTLAIMDPKAMDEAVDLLNKARRIIAIGVGASAIVALDFEQKLKRINKWCEALTDSHTQLTSAVHLQANDLVLAVSYSGETKEIIDTLKIVTANHAKVISLTGYGTNTVQKMADVNLFASPIEKSIRSGATASRIAQLNVIDILFTGLASINYKQSVDYLDKTRKAIQDRFK